MRKWVDFFAEFFDSWEDAEAFVEPLEALDSERDKRHPAKVMMHQTQRLVSLADDLPKIRQDSAEGLRLLFLLICAEHIAKMHDDFHRDGKSRSYVRQFFEQHLSAADKNRLQNGIRDNSNRSSTLKAASDALYDIRCDVVHEGNYWGFVPATDGTPMLSADAKIIVRLSFEELRTIVVRGCIRAIESRYAP